MDYTQPTFPWSQELLNRAKRTWGIEKWRMCQEGVVNGDYLETGEDRIS